MVLAVRPYRSLDISLLAFRHRASTCVTLHHPHSCPVSISHSPTFIASCGRGEVPNRNVSILAGVPKSRLNLLTTRRALASAATTNMDHTTAPSIPSETIAQLQQYTACDISDALLKLEVPEAGFIADVNPYSTLPSDEAAATVIAPVSTFLFVSKANQPSPDVQPCPNIPKEKHWVDLAQPGSFVVMKQASGQVNAICGGIMAVRMRVLGVKGILVAGRVRDLDELRGTELPIWAYGTSTVGSGASSTPWAAQVPLEINGTLVNPGDIAFNDPFNGTVIIPADKVSQVLELLPKLTAADEKVKEDVLKGMSVKEAFKLHRA